MHLLLLKSLNEIRRQLGTSFAISLTSREILRRLPACSGSATSSPTAKAPAMAQRLDRINRFLDGVKRNRREIVSPEGIVLEVDVANNGERLTAFVIDFLFWLLGTILLFLILPLLFSVHMNGAVAVTIIFFMAFLFRNLYFIHFELTSRGSTPGKRIVNLRVIDRGGGPLFPGAIVARNLTREVEIFLPLGLFFSCPECRTAWIFGLPRPISAGSS
jgi:uncharacterized RDD family membrane protein YckC